MRLSHDETHVLAAFQFAPLSSGHHPSRTVMAAIGDDPANAKRCAEIDRVLARLADAGLINVTTSGAGQTHYRRAPLR